MIFNSKLSTKYQKFRSKLLDFLVKEPKKGTGMESVTLFNQEDNHDKVYEVKLVNESGSYRVDFAYGRRGNNLKEGNKGTFATYQQAKLVFDKLVQKKMSEGYTI